MGRMKERLVIGHCDLEKRRIYFKGRVTASSESQTHYYVCCDIRERFSFYHHVIPEIAVCRTFNSSDYLLRIKTPLGLKYFEDREMKTAIKLAPKAKKPIGGGGYGEEGEELFDL